MKKILLAILLVATLIIAGCSLTGKSVADEQNQECKETQISYEVPQCRTESQPYTVMVPYTVEEIKEEENCLKTDFKFKPSRETEGDFHFWSIQEPSIWTSLKVESLEDEAEGDLRYTTQLYRNRQLEKEIEQIVHLKPREKKEIKVEIQTTEEEANELALTPLKLDESSIKTVVRKCWTEMGEKEDVTKYKEETKYKEVIVCMNVTQTKTVTTC
ncbi:hypothetical protein HY643_01550 [Candidatus Woesearchaeota archaeon]|nr:hypothetical protein [Candidatus Woesearchaeota archaeon]